ncbi:putative prolyl 3-hydroxylase [Helianthus annuus]|nr:putative prolyl 3-hydroxylase [Helianthus annuus]
MFIIYHSVSSSENPFLSPPMAESEHPRHILQGFLSPDICKELEFIHKSCSTIGYRQSVFSTTLSHLIATNSPHLIMPFIPLRGNKLS